MMTPSSIASSPRLAHSQAIGRPALRVASASAWLQEGRRDARAGGLCAGRASGAGKHRRPDCSRCHSVAARAGRDLAQGDGPGEEVLCAAWIAGARGRTACDAGNSDLAAAALDNKGSYTAAQATFETATKATAPEDLTKAKLDLAQAKANLDLEQSIVNARTELLKQGAIPGRDLDTAQATWSSRRLPTTSRSSILSHCRMSATRQR